MKSYETLNIDIIAVEDTITASTLDTSVTSHTKQSDYFAFLDDEANRS